MSWNSVFSADLVRFMPHGMCLLWQPGLMALHVVSDATIAVSYFAMPLAILRFVRGRQDLDRRHRSLAILFAVFIALCGSTHVVSIVVLWIPAYIAEGLLKAVTGVVSIAAAGCLMAVVPQAIKLPSRKAMQREIAAHRDTMLALDQARAALADRVGRTEGELRAAQRHRHHSLALLNTVVETVPGMVYVKDTAGRLILANQTALDLIGKSWSQVEGKREEEYIGDQRLAAIYKANDRRVMDTGEAEQFEGIFAAGDSGLRVFLSFRVPFRASDDAGRPGEGNEAIAGMVGVAIDITERKRIIEDNVDVSRRLAMGEMATAIAHEINQPLAAIALFLDGSMALLTTEHDTAALTESLRLAKEQCLRAGEIIRRVRSFVSDRHGGRQREDLPQLVNAACDLALIGALERRIAVSISHGSPGLTAVVDRLQIEQVIVNLVRNALDAVGDRDGAALWIATGHATADMVTVSVSDNGPGINAAVASNLFDPFVSTKGVMGMGVGLSICRTIIESHGGRIWVEPDTGIGATFRFSLPSRAAA